MRSPSFNPVYLCEETSCKVLSWWFFLLGNFNLRWIPKYDFFIVPSLFSKTEDKKRKKTRIIGNTKYPHHSTVCKSTFSNNNFKKLFPVLFYESFPLLWRTFDPLFWTPQLQFIAVLSHLFMHFSLKAPPEYFSWLRSGLWRCHFICWCTLDYCLAARSSFNQTLSVKQSLTFSCRILRFAEAFMVDTHPNTTSPLLCLTVSMRCFCFDLICPRETAPKLLLFLQMQFW